MPFYQQKPARIEAFQLDVDNAEELANWCGGVLVEEITPATDEAEEIRQPGINVPTPEGMLRASVGDYIWRSGVDFAVTTQSEFQATYEAVR